jgi:D-alanyl-D-alanine carboxypeptidase
MTGGMTISKVEEDTGTRVVVLMKEGRGSYSESTLELATTNPPVVARIGGHPVPSPQSAGHPASSDEDLAKRVQEMSQRRVVRMLSRERSSSRITARLF